MIRVLLYILFFFIFYLFSRLILNGLFGQKKVAGSEPQAEELVRDPYCQTYLSKKLALKKRVSGKDLHFCSEKCLRHYLEDHKTSGT